jgi:hypothetical protein
LDKNGREYLGKVQRRAVGMMSGHQHEYEERLKELGLKTLAERHRRANMHMVYTIMKNEYDLDHNPWFEKAEEWRRATSSVVHPDPKLFAS